MCAPCGKDDRIYPGSIQGTCADCGTKVWIAPSGQECKDKIVICIDCGLLRIEKDESAKIGILPKAIGEIKAFWRRN
jgi:hypothetical protein